MWKGLVSRLVSFCFPRLRVEKKTVWHRFVGFRFTLFPLFALFFPHCLPKTLSKKSSLFQTMLLGINVVFPQWVFFFPHFTCARLLRSLSHHFGWSVQYQTQKKTADKKKRKVRGNGGRIPDKQKNSRSITQCSLALSISQLFFFSRVALTSAKWWHRGRRCRRGGRRRRRGCPRCGRCWSGRPPCTRRCTGSCRRGT